MYKLSKLAAGSVVMATAALGCASAALADGYEPKGKMVYERPSDWSGFYFGLSSGYQWSSIDTRFTASGFSVDHDSGLVGGHLGLQHQWGNIVLGVEGNLMSAFKNEFGATNCPLNAAQSCTNRLSDMFTVGGRAGWAMGHWMPYLSGGYANAAFDYRASTKATGVELEEAHTRNNGWYAGGGFEWTVSPGWTTGLEYRHYEFDDKQTRAFTPGVGVNGPTTMGATTDTVMARVSWRFGREAPAPLK
jgi:opacity protein-like surface antigen